MCCVGQLHGWSDKRGTRRHQQILVPFPILPLVTQWLMPALHREQLNSQGRRRKPGWRVAPSRAGRPVAFQDRFLVAPSGNRHRVGHLMGHWSAVTGLPQATTVRFALQAGCGQPPPATATALVSPEWDVGAGPPLSLPRPPPCRRISNPDCDTPSATARHVRQPRPETLVWPKSSLPPGHHRAVGLQEPRL